jgi:hypothetical protein
MPTLGADLIGNGDEPKNPLGIGKNHNCLAGMFENREFFLYKGRTDTEFLHEQMVSHDIGCSIDPRAHPFSCDGRKVLSDEIGKRNAGFLCLAQQSVCEVMF